MIGGQIVPTHAMTKQLPLSQDVLWTRRSPEVCFICLSGLLRCLRLAMIDRHGNLLHVTPFSISSVVIFHCHHVSISNLLRLQLILLHGWQPVA